MLKGFLFSAVEAAIKQPGRLDLGLVYSDRPTKACGLFTTNTVKAAPVLLTAPKAAKGEIQAVVVNSGNANACTGPQGLVHAQSMAAQTARALKLDQDKVGVCSTGVIGRPMPLERIEAAIPGLVEGLSPDGLEDFSRAIMTTDTVPKVVSLERNLDGRQATLVGVAKGAGMIHPNLALPPQATMLVFLMTDAPAAAPVLKASLEEAMPASFHGITIDGDTSTNDSIIFMANGAAGGPEIEDPSSPAGRTFFASVKEVCQELAMKIVADAEGGTKVVTIHVKGAASESEAGQAATAIALSPLCKTAFFGADPNWGRIIAAAGRSGARFDPEKVDIFIDDAAVCVEGGAAGAEAVAGAEKTMKGERFTVTVDLKAGQSERVLTTSDLSIDYVKINAEYTT